jgi:hypothetical protein
MHLPFGQGAVLRECPKIFLNAGSPGVLWPEATHDHDNLAFNLGVAKLMKALSFSGKGPCPG